jgi:chromosome segregation ATPase
LIVTQGAHVSSVEALEDFRTNLIIYVSKARPTLEEVSAEVTRLKQWLENDQRIFWESQVRRRAKELEEAQQALFSSKISNLRKESAAEQNAYHRARRTLDEAEAKVRKVKTWGREFDSRAQPLVKQMEKLHTLLAHDMVKAIASLGEIAEALQRYAERSPVAAPVSAPASPGTPDTGGGQTAPS